ncbi:MAG: zinc ribbon domain-containing protein [Phycisphaerae bacterium]
MPTYEYECVRCGSVFEEFQSITAKPLRKKRCEKCRRVQPVRRRLGTGAAMLFKGGGFYKTDYRSESYRKAAEKETAKPAEKSDTTKPATKSGESSSSGATSKPGTKRDKPGK